MLSTVMYTGMVETEIKIPYSHNNVHSNVYKNPIVMCSMVSHESFLLLFRLQFVILQLLLESFST